MWSAIIVIQAGRQLFDIARKNVSLDGMKRSSRRRCFQRDLAQLWHLDEVLNTPGERKHFVQGIQLYWLHREFSPGAARQQHPRELPAYGWLGQRNAPSLWILLDRPRHGFRLHEFHDFAKLLRR